jgi:nucleoside-diphosphate-sugar epimerase
VRESWLGDPFPAPRRFTDPVTFSNNTLSTYNVFEAARRLRMKNIVWASSETVLGLPFETPPPYVPVDEECACPESAYSLSKLLGEEMAKQFCRWEPEMKIIGLRFSNVMEPHDYAAFADFEKDPHRRKWNLWGYIDARDAAQAIRRALEAPLKGADVFIIANSDTVMLRPTSELLAEVFPGVALKKQLGSNETLLSIDKARFVDAAMKDLDRLAGLHKGQGLRLLPAARASRPYLRKLRHQRPEANRLQP